MDGEQTAAVRGYVGVTDQDWYRFLADIPRLQVFAGQDLQLGC